MPFDLKTYDRPDAIKPYKGVFARADAREKAKAPVEVFASLDGGVDYVYIYGEIGGWGVWADDVIPLLEQIDGEGKEIEIRLQTNGGEVFEGQAIAVAHVMKKNVSQIALFTSMRHPAVFTETQNRYAKALMF